MMPVKVTNPTKPKAKEPEALPPEDSGITDLAPSLEVTPRKVNALEPYPNNPRKNDDAVPHMVSLIEKFGFRQPILVRGMRIVDGHLRVKAAKKLGMDKIPAIDVGALTETEERALRLAMNKSVEWAEWDTEALAIEFKAIESEGLDLYFTGFDTDAVDRILKDMEEDSVKVQKTLNADKGTAADPSYVSMTFHMTATQREKLRSALDILKEKHGVATRSQALVAALSSEV